MRSFNRFLLAGTSHLAILMMGAGMAWADDTTPKVISNSAGHNPTQALTSNSNLPVSTNLTAPTGSNAITIAPSLSDDASGAANVTVQSGVSVTGGDDGRKGIVIGKACASPPCYGQSVNTNITVETGASVNGGTGNHNGESAGRAIVIEDHIQGNTTIVNNGSIQGAVGGATYRGGMGIDNFATGQLNISGTGTIAGGNGGNGDNTVGAGAGGNASDGADAVSMSGVGSSLNVSGSVRIIGGDSGHPGDSTGGAAGSGSYSGNGITVGQYGGAPATVGANTSVTLSDSVQVIGGSGAAGGNGTTGTSGDNAGLHGGSWGVGLLANGSSLTTNDSVQVTGGNGGSGGNSSGVGIVGGTGGVGGSGIGIGSIGGPAPDNVTVNIGAGTSVTGGNGGDGGSGGDGANGGAGGDGAAGVIVVNAGSGIQITNRGAISGGSGGSGGAGGSGGSAGANGSNGGGVYVKTGTVSTLDNYGTINGGGANGGSAITAASGSTITSLTNRSGGSISNSGGTAINLSASTADSTITNYGTITGNVVLGVVTNSDHLLNLEGGSTLNGNVFATGNGEGNVNIGTNNAGITTLLGNIGSSGAAIHALTIANGATLKFGQDSQIHAGGISSINGMTFDFGTSRVEYHYYSSVGYTEDDSGEGYFKTTIDANAGKHGYFVIYAENGGAGSNVHVPIIIPTVVGTVTAGSKYVVMQDIPGRTASNSLSVVNSGGYRWTISEIAGTGQTDTDGVTMVSGSNNIVLTADRQNAAGSASGTNGSGVRALATYSGSDPAMQALSQAVNNLTSDADIKKAGAQLRPETTGNTAQASMGAVTQALSTIQVRTDAVRVAASETGTGVSSGETLKGLGVWGQGFGSTASQGERNDVSGYDADTYGLAFGADFKVIDPLRVGLSFAYAKTNVDSTGDRSGSGQDIGSYITSLYGTYSGKGWYVDGALTYGIHKYDATRHVAIAGAAAQTLKASYDGQQYGAKAEVGVPLAVGQAVVTPLASLAYNNLKQDGYAESGGAAALEVGSSSTDSIRSGLGAKVSAKVATVGNWEISPNARAVWHHEFNKSSQDQTSAYVAGGSSFTTPGTDIATEHFNLGLGIDVASVRNTTISAKYDADLADKYVSHSASLQLRTEF